MKTKIRESTSIAKALAHQITHTNSNTERNTPMNRKENTHDAVNCDTLCDSNTGDFNTWLYTGIYPFHLNFPEVVVEL